MDAEPAAASANPLSFKEGLLWFALAAGSFHLAYAFTPLAFLIALFLFSVLQLARAPGKRLAFYPGLAVGMFCYGPKLLFFWTVFGPSAVALWLVLAFWIGLFVLLIHLCREQFGARWAAIAAPFVWMGLEYFRSELYYLRFSWLNAGYAFAWSPALPALKWLGMYGVGFVLMALTAGVARLADRPRIIAGAALLGVLGFATYTGSTLRSEYSPHNKLRVAGMQFEFLGELEVVEALKKLHATHPEAQLLVLSEYTFDGPAPDRVRAWCRTNKIYLAVGGKDESSDGSFRNTVFVVGPTGDVVFQQAKSVPIQFFKDGLPAESQRVWDSPWGRLGICICYDLSYTRVVDELVRQGAQALIVPTMDVAEWGEAQHVLHSRVAPVRAAEHGLQIFRLASSGISQWTDERGRVRASAPFPGEGSMLAAELRLMDKGSRPLDRALAPAATALTALLAAWLLALAAKKKFSRPAKS